MAAPRYIVQVRQHGEPWFTQSRVERLSAAIVRADWLASLYTGLEAPVHQHIRVVYRGQTIYDPRAIIPVAASC
ncbi:MAG TPA: hypothetical protein DCQ64_19935 [Candidatus Rokubacteria bacterium]|nr:hypothetical protein [Candidatus Rokubacteria bacterium]